MTKGIYIMANDRVTEQAIALLKSLRFYDSDTPVVLIPYDDEYQQVAGTLRKYGVTLYKDLELLKHLSQQLYDIFGSGFFARPNQFRKQACWFGEFDEFLYIDTDIVVFEKIIDTLDYLKIYDFISCDYQHLGGLKNVFTPKVISDRVFTEKETTEIFNCGFWGAKKTAITEEILFHAFRECAAHPDYFDFSEKTSDQPIINYMILHHVPRRCNLVQRSGGAPGSWAGSPHFQVRGDRLFDPQINQPLQYLHWAGIKIQPGCPYWQIWKHYRYLYETAPDDTLLLPLQPRPQKFTPKIIRDIKRSLRKNLKQWFRQPL